MNTLAITRPANTPQRQKARERAMTAQWKKDLRMVRALKSTSGKPVLRYGGNRFVLKPGANLLQQVAQFV
jgi:hypothetical protein